MIKNFCKITEEGEFLPPDWAKKSLEAGDYTIKKVIGAQWQDGEQLIVKKYPYAIRIEALKNKGGVLACERTDIALRPREVVLYEADGSEHFRIKVPTISEYSNPDEAYFYWVEFDKNTDEVWLVLHDGASDYRARLNMQTGELMDFVQTRV